jgi:hypothetical protein
VGNLTIKQVNSTTDQGLPPEGSLVKLVTAKLLDFLRRSKVRGSEISGSEIFTAKKHYGSDMLWNDQFLEL